MHHPTVYHLHTHHPLLLKHEMTEREMRELLQTYGAMAIEQSKEKSVQMLELLDTSLTGTLTREEFLSKEGCMELLLAFRSIHEVDDAVSEELLTTTFKCTDLPCSRCRYALEPAVWRGASKKL